LSPAERRLDYATFLQQAERGEPPALILLHGGDVQLLDDALDAVTRGLFPDRALAAWGREVFDARESAVDEIVRAASTLPLGVDRRLVAVRRAQALAAKGADALGGYARSPNPASCLVLLADEPLRASRERRTDHWLLGALPATAIVELPTRGARDLAGWIRQRAALDGLTVSDEAAQLLVELAGEDTATILGEARKAALAGGPDNRTVGVKDVAAIVGEQRLDDIFDLTRAVERRDRAGALKTLDRLLATEDAMLLLTVLARDVRTAWNAVAQRRRGRSVEEIARALRRHPRVIETLTGSTSGSEAHFAWKLRRCWEAEHRLKSSGEPRAEMVALVADLCGER
jgi:DNA polymerase-3 subunit delta